MTQCHSNSHCTWPVMIHSPSFINENAFASFYAHFYFSFFPDDTHHACFIWSPKEWIWRCFCELQPRSNGVGKSKLAPSNSLQTELSNCLCFAYIIPQYDADPSVWSDDWWPSNKNMKTYTKCTFIWTVYKWTTTILSFALVHWLSNYDPISILTFSLKVLHWRLTKLPITSTKLHLQHTLTTLIQITELT